MSERTLYRRIVANETGAWSAPLRALLRAGECVYAGGVTLRNRYYDRPAARTTLPIPVISVGNLTVGGTGKTPFVIDLVHRLDRMGLSPVVVARGYKSVGSRPSDEERLIHRHCPQVPYVADPDRVYAAQHAHDVLGADVIVLDDGFQHRRLHRTVDVVMVDATCPFGFGHVLPRGLLREPIGALRRAHVVVRSRCDQVSPAALSRLDARLCELAPEATHLACAHRVTAIERLDGTPWEGTLDTARSVAFAAIARPEAFVTGLRLLGVEVVATRFWKDHHDYTVRDVDSLLRSGRFPSHDWLITTEKDAVKLAELGVTEPSRILVARIDIDFIDNGGTMLQSVLDKMVEQAKPT